MNYWLGLVLVVISLFSGYSLVHATEERAGFEREFVIALQAQPTTLDPQGSVLLADFQLALHLFDYPLNKEVNEYERLDPLTWRFTLKEKRYFSNGQPLTTKDIVYTLNRALAQTAKNLFLNYSYIRSYRAIDPYTLEVSTRVPIPDFPYLFGEIPILPYQTDLMATEDFMPIGSGPYRLVEWLPNGDIRLEANPYYQEPLYVRQVRFTVIPDARERVRALKEKRVDMISSVPVEQIDELKAISHAAVAYSPTDFVAFLALDTYRDTSPFIRDYQGKPLAQNPLKKLAVRQAIAYALNRPRLVDEVLYGNGTPAYQLVRPEYKEHVRNLIQDSASPQQAKALLQQAGYPDGFQLILHYLNNTDISVQRPAVLAKAIASQLAAVGIKTQLIGVHETGIFMNGMYNAHYSAHIGGIMPNGDYGALLMMLLHSHIPHSKKGVFNSGRYSNPLIDQLLAKSEQEFDKNRRLELYFAVMEVAMKDKPLIPLYFQGGFSLRRNDIGIESWDNRYGIILAQDIYKVQPLKP